MHQHIRFIAPLSFYIFLCFAIPEAVFAATYYVDNTITDTNVGSATADCTNYDPAAFTCSGGSGSAYKTIADVNAGSFLPDDQILFRRGQMWREALTVPSSGTSGHHITFSAFGSGSNAIIAAADVMNSGWSSYSGNTWQKTLTTPTKLVHLGGQALHEGASKDSLHDHEWKMDWVLGIVYLRNDSGNPHAGAVEISQRQFAINTNARNYITIDAIDVYGGMMGDRRKDPGGNINVRMSDNVIVRNLNSYRADNQGVYVQGSSNITIDNNTLHDIMAHIVGNAGDGIMIDSSDHGVAGSTNVTVTNNQFTGYFGRWPLTITDCNGALVSGNSFNATSDIGFDLETDDPSQDIQNIIIDGNTFSVTGWGESKHGAISLAGPNGTVTGVTISNNTIDGQGGNAVGVNKATAVDIKNNTITNVGTALYGTEGAEVTFRYNNVTANADGYGIYTETVNAGVTMNVYYNIFKENVISFNAGSGTTAYVYNNVFGGYVWVRPSSYVTLKNNIFTTALTHVIKQGTLVSDYNLFFPDGPYAFWDGSSGFSLATWRSAFSLDLNSRTDGPLFTNPSGGDFTLQATSPAIDAGTDLGTTYQLGLEPGSSWPSSVSTLNQNSYGTGWDMGAYVYGSAPTTYTTD